MTHHSTQKEMDLLHWSGVIKTSARMGEGVSKDSARIARRRLYLCVCVCVMSSALRPHHIRLMNCWFHNVMQIFCKKNIHKDLVNEQISGGV
jgi:hypothetical protein